MTHVFPDWFSGTGMGLHVRDGEVAGFCCGIYGYGDTIFIDFVTKTDLNPTARNTFYAGDIPSGIIASGTYAIFKVPEPDTILLVALTLAALTWSRSRRNWMK